jgi:hypothetical protein
MRRRWSELELAQAETVWEATRGTFLSQVMGPHFEAVCRDFVSRSGPSLFGGHPAHVGSGVVNDSAERGQIEIDVAVFAPQEPGKPQRVLSLGEAKWGEVMDSRHIQRLARARDILAGAGYDAGQTVLACYSGAGFRRDLVESDRLRLIGLDRIYAPPS